MWFVYISNDILFLILKLYMFFPSMNFVACFTAFHMERIIGIFNLICATREAAIHSIVCLLSIIMPYNKSNMVTSWPENTFHITGSFVRGTTG